MTPKIKIVSIYPSLLGTYGDGGNVMALGHIGRAHGIEVEVHEVSPGESTPGDGDIYVLGGGEDTAQVAAANAIRDEGVLSRVAADGVAVLAICAGYQLLGTEFPSADGSPAPGVGILDVTTTRLPARAVGELLATPSAKDSSGQPLLKDLLTGYENHAGATHVGPGATPLAHVSHGIGNGDGTEGATVNRTIGTYLHGPCLARNPELAELLLGWATDSRLEPIRDPAVQELRRIRLSVASSSENTVQTKR